MPPRRISAVTAEAPASAAFSSSSWPPSRDADHLARRDEVGDVRGEDMDVRHGITSWGK
jgi:hypothetical protein